LYVVSGVGINMLCFWSLVIVYILGRLQEQKSYVLLLRLKFLSNFVVCN